MKIAAQLFTLRKFTQTPEGLSESLRKVKKIGYNAVQMSGLGPIDHQQVKEIADQAGIEICATHVGYEKLVHNLDEVIAQHKLWDCRYVGLGGLPDEYRSAQGYAKFATEASEIGRQLKQAGLTFIYHNHHFEFAKYEGKSGMEILLEHADPKAFEFELDVYWVHAGGADAIEWIRKVDGQMKVVHLKDMVITHDKHEQRFAEIGEGNMNFKGILQACEAIGVEWAAVEQDLCYDRDPMESLQISFNNLMKLGAKA